MSPLSLAPHSIGLQSLFFTIFRYGYVLIPFCPLLCKVFRYSKQQTIVVSPSLVRHACDCLYDLHSQVRACSTAPLSYDLWVVWLSFIHCGYSSVFCGALELPRCSILYSVARVVIWSLFACGAMYHTSSMMTEFLLNMFSSWATRALEMFWATRALWTFLAMSAPDFRLWKFWAMRVLN